MKMLEGPWHDAWGVSITMPSKLGIHETAETVTIIGSKDMVESLSVYLTGKDLTSEAKPMAAGTPMPRP